MLFASNGVCAQGVVENNWIKIDSSIFADTYVNKQSIIVNKDEVTVWTKYELSGPIKPNPKTKLLFKENTIYAFASNRSFDCKRISSSVNKNGIYNEKKEFIASDENEKPESAKTLAAPDSSMYEEIKRICDFSKNGKINNKGWEFIPLERFKQYKDKLDDERSLIKKEMDSGVYGADGILSQAGLKRLGNIANLENRIENISINNIYALEYTSSRYLKECSARLKQPDSNFTNTDECIKSRKLLNELDIKGVASAQITLIGINVIHFKDQINYAKSLTTLFSIDVSKLTQPDAENLIWAIDRIKENLTEKEIIILRNNSRVMSK